MNKKAVLFLIHIPVWIIVLAFIFFKGIQNIQTVGIPYVISSYIIVAFWLLSSFYVFYSYLGPKYLKTGRYKKFAVYAALFVFIVMPFILGTLSTINLRVLGEHTASQLPSTGFPSSRFFLPAGTIAFTLFYGGLGTFYRFGIDWFKNRQLKNDLENKNLQSEIKALKSKLNPHLLFNTLNNIDTLIQTDPEQASSALSKLSDLLRYVVYDTENEKIPIQKEIENLKKYIDLEKIRLVNPDSVIFSCSVAKNTNVPPMIFLPFVENGFKHSNLNNPNHKLQISILGDNNKISFNCTNTVNDKRPSSNDGGVGLELAKKRLGLLYPDNHEISIEQRNGEFHVALEIKLVK